jgi:hypothetical protein
LHVNRLYSWLPETSAIGTQVPISASMILSCGSFCLATSASHEAKMASRWLRCWTESVRSEQSRSIVNLCRFRCTAKYSTLSCSDSLSDDMSDMTCCWKVIFNFQSLGDLKA